MQLPKKNTDHRSGRDPIPMLLFNIGSVVINQGESQYDEEKGRRPLQYLPGSHSYPTEMESCTYKIGNVASRQHQSQGRDNEH